MTRCRKSNSVHALDWSMMNSVNDHWEFDLLQTLSQCTKTKFARSLFARIRSWSLQGSKSERFRVTDFDHPGVCQCLQKTANITECLYYSCQQQLHQVLSLVQVIKVRRDKLPWALCNKRALCNKACKRMLCVVYFCGRCCNPCQLEFAGTALKSEQTAAFHRLYSLPPGKAASAAC